MGDYTSREGWGMKPGGRDRGMKPGGRDGGLYQEGGMGDETNRKGWGDEFLQRFRPISPIKICSHPYNNLIRPPKTMLWAPTPQKFSSRKLEKSFFEKYLCSLRLS